MGSLRVGDRVLTRTYASGPKRFSGLRVLGHFDSNLESVREPRGEVLPWQLAHG